MRDYQEVIIKFVQIVERYPEVYNSLLESYRSRRNELAWEQIADLVRTELGEQCTVEEIKSKWKGIRSSYNRFKNRLRTTNLDGHPRKKYYLYDSLKFLEPYVKSKRTTSTTKDNNFENCDNTISDDDKSQDDYDREMETFEIKIKSEVPEDILNTAEMVNVNIESMDTRDAYEPEFDTLKTDSLEPHTSNDRRSRKRKCEDTYHEDCEDLQFFKSILPDIKKFSVKEKRKLKMGILNLIDEIDDARNQGHPQEVSSSRPRRES